MPIGLTQVLSPEYGAIPSIGRCWFDPPEINIGMCPDEKILANSHGTTLCTMLLMVSLLEPKGGGGWRHIEYEQLRMTHFFFFKESYFMPYRSGCGWGRHCD